MNWSTLNGLTQLVSGQIIRVNRKKNSAKEGETPRWKTQVTVEFRGAPGQIEVATDYFDEEGKNQTALSAEMSELKVGEWVTFQCTTFSGIGKTSGKPFCMYEAVQVFDQHESSRIDSALTPVGDVVAPPAIKKAA